MHQDTSIPAAAPTMRRARRCAALVASVAVLAGGMGAAPPVVEAAEPVTVTATALGQTPQEAAVSCWDIKRQRPSAASGSYWLVTPTLGAPGQFYCDMTTDGGGWVLIGRGRNGWNLSYNGQGTPDEVRGPVDGPSAFAPRALSSEVVDGLLDGTRPDQLPDGVRLRRATTTDGTGRQEVRFRLADRDRWVWSFGAYHPVASFRVDGVSGTGGVTRDFGVGTGLQRVRAGSTGWGFGADITGSNTATSYVGVSPSGAVALPFTQVFIRPRLTSANTTFPAIPDTGAPASAQRRLLSNVAERGEWGVTGRANQRTGERNAEVQAFAQSGNRMIVGGNFELVQRGDGATGADRVAQPFLAAFDVRTGAFISQFRPVLNGQVKDLHTLPNGSVVAAGEFTSVNGVATTGLVALDPVTGATDPSFRVRVENRVTGEGVAVEALDAHGPWLYLGGAFTHFTAGGQTVYARNAARVSLATGAPDPAWAPVLFGTVIDLDVSARGDRVYLAGFMSALDGEPVPPVVVLTTAAGAGQVPGLAEPRFSANTNYQQAILEAGNRVWHGGAQHMLFSYARDDFASLSGNIALYGGDFQALTSSHGVVYGGCHCGDFNYSGIYSYFVWNPERPPDPGFTQADNIRFTGAWDVVSGEYIPDFVPGLETIREGGPWALTVDTNGTMWMGGDFSRARTTGNSWQWVGGFVRYAERDSVAPTSPSALRGTDRSGTTTLEWDGSTDDRGAVTYEILRHDRVVATSSVPRISLPSPGPSARYFVRAIDAAGNRSATTGVFVPTPFHDTADNVHAEMIGAIARAEITLGCNAAGTAYCPGAPVSREQMASFLVRAFDLPPASRDHFDDDATSTHQSSINRLAEAGITEGLGGRRFDPGGTVTREQMATFLARALKLEPRPSGPFTDVAGVHAPNVNAIAAAGISLGCGSSTVFCPGDPVRRDQMASFIGRALGLS